MLRVRFSQNESDAAVLMVVACDNRDKSGVETLYRSVRVRLSHCQRDETTNERTNENRDDSGCQDGSEVDRRLDESNAREGE
jgi:hypothetical protein